MRVEPAHAAAVPAHRIGMENRLISIHAAHRFHPAHDRPDRAHRRHRQDAGIPAPRLRGLPRHRDAPAPRQRSPACKNINTTMDTSSSTRRKPWPPAFVAAARAPAEVRTTGAGWKFLGTSNARSLSAARAHPPSPTLCIDAPRDYDYPSPLGAPTTLRDRIIEATSNCWPAVAGIRVVDLSRTTEETRRRDGRTPSPPRSPRCTWRHTDIHPNGKPAQHSHDHSPGSEKARALATTCGRWRSDLPRRLAGRPV